MTLADPTHASIYSSLHKAMTNPKRGLHTRVVPGQPDQSGLLARMESRDLDTQMPPLATEQPDPHGLAAIAAWISQLR